MRINEWWQRATPAERDKLVDTGVFNHTPVWAGVLGWICTDCDSSGGPVRPYSQNIKAALEIVARLREDGLHLRLNDTLSQYRAQFFTAQDGQTIKDDGRYYEFSESPECAICLAALRVKGVARVDMPIIGGGE